MRNIKLTIEYDGTNYHGWQTQPNKVTIQETIESALTKMTKTETQIVGAGRTDSGVHAAGQVANFHTPSQIPLIAFQKGLNSLLPRDIVILDVEEVPPDFHARFSAKRREYRYAILNRPYSSALLRNYVYFLPERVDAPRMDAVCRALVGKRDFSSFQKSNADRVNPVCEVFECRCWREGDRVYFKVVADSFLRGMVRAIIGTALMLQNREDPEGQLHRILEARDRSAAGPSVPAHGLCLVRVEYD